MHGELFDDVIAHLQRSTVRRRAALRLLASSVLLAGFRSTTVARKRGKRKKKRCGRLQAACRSNQACCPGKTGRVCASNDKDVQCRGGGNVCCLPLDAFGCNDNCDCCGGNTGCNDAGQCRVLF